MWVDVEQNTPEWQSLRLGKVTASGAALFMANYGKSFGEPAKRYAEALALQQVTGLMPPSYSNEQMQRGHEQEPVARALYEAETFQSVKNGGFFDYGTHGCSPDGLIDGGAIEVKSVLAGAHFATLKRQSYDPAYKWQIASQLDCEGIEFVDFVSFCADFPAEKQLLIFRVTRTDFEAELNQLRERRPEFLKLVDENLLLLKS